MTWSRYLTAIRPSLQRSQRNSAIQSVILHHGATTNDEWMIQAMVSGSKQVSATVVVKDNRRTGVVDEDYRPWTSSSPYWDGRSCTIECANESVNGWTISDASYESLAIMLADWSIRYKFPLIRNGRNSTVFGHRELYLYFGDSYATACPGGMDVDRVVRRANEIIGSQTAGGGASPILGEDEMAEVIMKAPNGQIVHLFPGVKHAFASLAEYNKYRSDNNFQRQRQQSTAAVLPPADEVTGVTWESYKIFCAMFGVQA